MKRLLPWIVIGMVFLAVGFRLDGARRATSDTEAPATVWAECRRLESRMQAVDNEIQQLESEIERLQKTLENHEFVRERNSATLEKLRKWADTE